MNGPVDIEQVRRIIEAVIRPDGHLHGETDYWCPFCERNGYSSPSHLHVNYSKGKALCHQCGWATQNLLYLIRALTGSIPRSLTRAQLGVDLEEYVRSMFVRDKEENRSEDDVDCELPKEFIPLPERPKDRTGRVILDYLRNEREVTREMMDEVGVGYCTEGRYRGYAIFPIYVGGKLVTYTSRRVVALGSKVQHAVETKSRIAVFNYDVAMTTAARRVFVGEGPFDAWAFHRRARSDDVGVGILGKKLHREQARLLDRLPAEEFCVCLDDTEHARTVLYASLLARLTTKRISYILLREGSGDPHKNRRRLAGADGYVANRVRYDALMSEVEKHFA